MWLWDLEKNLKEYICANEKEEVDAGCIAIWDQLGPNYKKNINF